MANEIRIIFSALDQVSPIVRGITAPLRGLGKDLGGLTEKLVTGKINFGEWTSKVGGAVEAVTGMSVATLAAVAAVALLTKEIVEAAISIQPYIEQTRKYDQIMRSYGLSSQEYFRQLKEASGYAFDSQTLMTRANDMAIAGGREMLDLYPKLISYTMAYSQATGREATWALDRLVLGMLRGSARILDDIGLVMSARQVYKDYAEAINKTTSELTGLEKRQAIWAETEILIEDKLKALGEYSWSGAAAVRGLKATWKDFTLELKRFMGLALEDTIKTVAGAIQLLLEMFIKGLKAANEWLETIKAVKVALEAMGRASTAAVSMLSPQWSLAYANVQAAQGQQGWALPPATPSLRETYSPRERAGPAEQHYVYHIMDNARFEIAETADIDEVMDKVETRIVRAEHDILRNTLDDMKRRQIIR